MTITVCPVALMGMGKCWDAQCHLRHDVVHCKPCKCFVLHGELAKHRRGEDHQLKCGFGEWKAGARRPARAILPSPDPYVPAPKPLNKRARLLARKEELASTGTVVTRGGEAQHLSVSGEEGLDFKSEVGVGIDKTIPVIIQKTADNVSLTLVDVVVTGAGSRGFSVIESLPMKIKGKEQRAVHVSFVPAAPGDWDARLVLRFLHVSLGKHVTLVVTRRLHGVATSAEDKPQAPQSPDDIKCTQGIRASQRQQLRGTRQRRDTGRDSPKSY
ncbi:hypothetical protein EDB84DRAFT_1202007 [Lactarius hengduanensis]|nr:hypothetical protein EDB84DRAFT_1202007 [Lactarius hengduanensis]